MTPRSHTPLGLRDPRRLEAEVAGPFGSDRLRSVLRPAAAPGRP